MNAPSTNRTPAAHTPHKPQPIAAADHPDALLQASTVMTLAGMGKSTLYTLVREGKFPAPIRRGARCTRWKAGEVTAWLKAQASVTPDPAPATQPKRDKGKIISIKQARA